MRDAAGLAPPLSWLAVWNRQLIARQGEEGEDEDSESQAIDHIHRAGVLYSKSYSDNRALLARRIGLAQGLVDFTRSFARSQSKQDTHTTSEDPPQTTIIHPIKDIKVVQSQNQRLVFLQPESDFWIVAAFDRYLPQTTPSQLAEIPAKSNKNNKVSLTPSAKLHPASFLPNEVLADLLKRAYAEYRLFNGTLANALDSEGQEKLRAKISTFFDIWQNEARLIPLGIPRAQPSSAHQFLQPPSGYTIIAVSQKGVLDTSSTVSASDESSNNILTPSDHLAISCHLATLLPKLKPSHKTGNSTASSIKSDSPTNQGKGKKVKKQPSLSSSTWKSLHLSGITNYLPSMPSMPGTSSSSSNPSSANSSQAQDTTNKVGNEVSSTKTSLVSDQIGQGPLKAQHKKRTPSGSAWIPTFSLFGTSSSSPKDKRTVPKKEIGQVNSTPLDTSTNEAQTTTDNATSCVTEERPDLSIGDLPDSAASEVSMEALSEAIQETISPEVEAPETLAVEDTLVQAPDAEAGGKHRINALEALASDDKLASDTPDDEQTESEAEARELKPDLTVQSKFRAIWHETRTVYIGDEFTPVDCYRLSSDDIAMALIPKTTSSSESTHANDGIQDRVQEDTKSDKTVIDQYFTHLATLQAYPPPSAMPQNPRSRTFLSFGGNANASDVIEQIIDDRASATNASLGQRYNLAINAKTDTEKLIKSDTREIFVRTHFSQWLVAEQDPKSDNFPRLTILPKSIGKEGSLLDADAEMQRIR